MHSSARSTCTAERFEKLPIDELVKLSTPPSFDDEPISVTAHKVNAILVLTKAASLYIAEHPAENFSWVNQDLTTSEDNQPKTNGFGSIGYAFQDQSGDCLVCGMERHSTPGVSTLHGDPG